MTKSATAPDKRPALVFDNINEVLTIINALESFRAERTVEKWTSDGHISTLVTELEKVASLFKKES